MEVKKEDAGNGRGLGAVFLEHGQRHNHTDHGAGVSDPAYFESHDSTRPIDGEGIPSVSKESNGRVDPCEKQLFLGVVSKTGEESGTIDYQRVND